MSNEEEMRLRYNEYVKAIEEAYKTEADFYANKPKSLKLGKKVKKAYQRFDEARKKVYGS